VCQVLVVVFGHPPSRVGPSSWASRLVVTQRVRLVWELLMVSQQELPILLPCDE
jgi:hypothetical protein